MLYLWNEINLKGNLWYHKDWILTRSHLSWELAELPLSSVFRMLKWAWSMLVLKICFLFSLLTTYQNVKGKSSCSCSAFPLPAFMSAQFVFHSLPAPRAAPAAALARLSLGVRLLSTFHLAACAPCCTPTSPFPVSHKWELPSLLSTLICLCQKNPAFLHRGVVISVIFTCW